MDVPNDHGNNNNNNNNNSHAGGNTANRRTRGNAREGDAPAAGENRTERPGMGVMGQFGRRASTRKSRQGNANAAVAANIIILQITATSP
jgi:hypothetical protein